MPSFNEDLADRFTAHAIDMERVKGDLRRKTLKMLKDLEKELTDLLKQRDLTTFNRRRYEALLKTTQETVSLAYRGMRETVLPEIAKIAKYSAKAGTETINTLARVELASVSVSPDTLTTIASDALIEGAPTREWWARAEKNFLRKFSDTVRMGLMRGEPTPKIVQMVRQETFVPASRGLTALVRSSVGAVDNASLLATYESNPDVIAAIQQRSVLDGRTTKICIAYSGKVWTLADKTPIGHKLPFNAGPPRHWACRSTLVPITKSFDQMRSLITGGRRSKSAEKYFTKRLREMGMSDEAIDRAVKHAQASMDGQVSEDLTYEDWLRAKPERFQKEVLGPARWDLWRRGKLKRFEDLIDMTGQPRTVADLEAGRRLKF